MRGWVSYCKTFVQLFLGRDFYVDVVTLFFFTFTPPWSVNYVIIMDFVSINIFKKI